MKESNKKFEGFAHNLIAESLKRWAKNSTFVADKLRQRLTQEEKELDDLDRKIGDIIFKRVNGATERVADFEPTNGNYEY